MQSLAKETDFFSVLRTTYWVQCQEPIWSRVVKIHEDLLIGKLEFTQGNLHTLRPTTSMIGVEFDFWWIWRNGRGHIA